MRLFRFLRTTIMVLLLVGSVSLNVATVAFTSVAMVLSTAFEAVTGAASVVGGANRSLDAKTKEVEALRRSQTVRYRGQQKLVSEAVQDTTTRVARRTAAAAIRSTSSMAAEAIPVIGIAAIVGITAWDLKDSCDTMKDLRELEQAFSPDAAIEAEVGEVCGMTVPTKDDVYQSVRSSPRLAWQAAKSYVPELPEFKLPTFRDLMFWDISDEK